MRRRVWQLLLGLLASCAPERAYEPPTTTAAVILRRPPTPTVQPTPQPPPPQVERPPHEMSTAAATATVLGAALGLPLFVELPSTPETVTLSHTLPPIGTSGNLPGTIQVIATLHAVRGVAIRMPGVIGTPQPFIFWLFPFLPFGLSKAGGP